jgi:hypothetical protein
VKTCWQKDDPGASPGLRPGDEVTIPAGLGWPVDKRQSVERVATVIAISGSMALTADGTFVPMYNPNFVATERHFETADIPAARRQFLLDSGWEVLGESTSTETPRG